LRSGLFYCRSAITFPAYTPPAASSISTAFATVSVGYFLTAHSIASRCSGREHGQQPLLGLLAAFLLQRNQLAQALHETA
jgi:hypothetical protein